MKNSNKPVQRVVFQPAVYQSMRRGIEKITNAVRPTLGPLPRIVAMSKVGPNSNGLPELLDSAGTIARRIIAVPDRDEDMGAMYLRQILWKQLELKGDGSATTAVIFERLFKDGVRFITAGGSQVDLCKHLDDAMRQATAAIERRSTPLRSEQQIAHFASSLSFDRDLGKTIGEIFTIVGEFGVIEVRQGRGREIEREYVEGTVLNMALMTKSMLNDPTSAKAKLEDTAIFISDLEFKQADDLTPLVQAALNAGHKRLVIVAKEIAEPALAWLVRVNKQSGSFQVFAVRSPAPVNGQAVWLEDLAILTGGRVFLTAFGNRATTVKPEDFGHARRAWADETFFSVVGGKRDPRALRKHIETLQELYRRSDEPEKRKVLRERIGKLMGGAATLWVGAVSQIEIEARKERAIQTLDATRAAMLGGVVPGGGAALLECSRELLAEATRAKDPVRKLAFRMMSAALEEPTRVILNNAGLEPAVILPAIEKAGAGFGYDISSRRVTKMLDAGVMDAADVLSSAVFQAVSGVTLALSVGVFVHHKKPRFTANP